MGAGSPAPQQLFESSLWPLILHRFPEPDPGIRIHVRVTYEEVLSGETMKGMEETGTGKIKQQKPSKSAIAGKVPEDGFNWILHNNS